MEEPQPGGTSKAESQGLGYKKPVHITYLKGQPEIFGVYLLKKQP